jgi:hypothetical protein
LIIFELDSFVFISGCIIFSKFWAAKLWQSDHVLVC